MSWACKSIHQHRKEMTTLKLYRSVGLHQMDQSMKEFHDIRYGLFVPNCLLIITQISLVFSCL